MYRLATMYSVTDRQTDGQTDNSTMPIDDHTAWHRLKIQVIAALVSILLT